MEFVNDHYENITLNSVTTPFTDGYYKPDPSFWDTVGAQNAYQYMPFLNHIRNRLAFEEDVNYNPIADIEGSEFEDFEDDLMHAVSAEHMYHLKGQIIDYRETREVLANSSLWQQFGAALFDPLNFIALPFGGPAVGMLRSATRVGIGTGLIQAGVETVRHPFDPLSTPEEVAYNIGGAVAIGGLLGGAISAPMTYRFNAISKTEQEQLEFMKQIQNKVPDTHAKFIGQKNNPERTFGKLSDKELTTLITKTKKEQTPASQNARIELAAERSIREIEAKLPKRQGPYDIMANAFTNSWIYKAIPTPLKHTLQNNYTMNQKKSMLGLIGDLGTYIGINKYGAKSDTPVYIEASTYEGEWVQSYNSLLKLYGEYTGKGVPKETKIDLLFFRKGFDEFVEDLARKRIREDRVAGKLSRIDRKGIGILDEFFDTWGNRLEEQNLILRKASQVDSEIARLDREIATFRRTKSKNATEQKLRTEYLERLERQKFQMDRQRTAYDSNGLGKAKERFFPRIWDKEYITNNREDFANVLRAWYKTNPFVYKFDNKKQIYDEVKLLTNDSAVESRVQETIDTILGDMQPTNTDTISFGGGQSNHFKHRQLDIPNYLIDDFIIKNPVKIMMGYTNRVAAQYSFTKKFGDSDVENVMSKLAIEAARDGQSMKQVMRFNKNFRHGYDRVAGYVLRNPLAFNQSAAQVMKDLATLNYLGSAGFSTLPDAAVVLMQNELKPTFKQLFRVLDNEKVRLNAMEGQLAGEILDTLKGEVMLRLMEDMTNNPFQSNLRSKAKNAFFQLNLLGPATGIFKRFSSMANVHTLLDYSVKLSKGTATVKQRQHLARLGIGLDDAKKIAKQKWETENGIYYANATKWKDQDVLFKFRTALNASIKHQVLMGSPADKPIAVDGVFYVPNHVARYIPFVKPDQRYQGYSRIENGLLGLPFQFYSYSLAALNKVTVLTTQGQTTNRFVGITAAMGLAYMGMQIKYRNNPYILDQMSIEDKIARSFDMSGLGAIYSDMFYTSMATSMALGGPNIGGGIVNPKYPQEKNYVDAATGFLGAGPSISVDLVRAAGEFTMGDTGEGAKDFIRNLPFMRLWFLKEITNDMTRALAGGNRY